MDEATQLLSEYAVRLDSLEESRKEHIMFEQRLNELERSVDVIGERNHHYEVKLDSMERNMELVASKQDTLKERMPSRDEWTEMKKSIEALKGKSGRTYDRIKGIALTAIVSGAFTYFLIKFLEQVAP